VHPNVVMRNQILARHGTNSCRINQAGLRLNVSKIASPRALARSSHRIAERLRLRRTTFLVRLRQRMIIQVAAAVVAATTVVQTTVVQTTVVAIRAGRTTVAAIKAVRPSVAVAARAGRTKTTAETVDRTRAVRTKVVPIRSSAPKRASDLTIQQYC
jgi:hypothetical protein